MTTDRPASELMTRLAHLADVPEMVRLFAALGYAIEPDVLATRFAAFDGLGEQALVAVRNSGRDAPVRLLGLATLHATPVLHRAGPVGRVTALVVDPDSRGQGIGRRLMAAAEAWATARGCVLIEVTSNRRRTDAHAFYERLGYEATSFRFGKALAPSP
jgi:GNAT superfamily N-acetyltransferase